MSSSATITLPDGIELDIKEGQPKQCSKDGMVRFYKGMYRTKESLMREFKDISDNVQFIKDFIYESFDDAEPFSIKECFQIEDDEFRRIVFESVDIDEMMDYINPDHYTSDGIKVNTKVFDEEGNHVDTVEKHNVYQVHVADAGKLDSRLAGQSIYILKCWCTSTNNHHWIWIDERHKDDPLEAVASTFRIHKNLLNYLKEIKRQGDVLITELTEDVEPEGEIVSLDKETYFKYLSCET